MTEKFGWLKKSAYLCIAIKKNGPVAQLNRASDYGSEGYRFESCRGHFKRDAKQLTINCLAFFSFNMLPNLRFILPHTAIGYFY